jgi:hypothetical protein
MLPAPKGLPFTPSTTNGARRPPTASVYCPISMGGPSTTAGKRIFSTHAAVAFVTPTTSENSSSSRKRRKRRGQSPWLIFSFLGRHPFELILSKYLGSTDKYTKGHSVHVSEFAMETAIAMQLHRSEVEDIRVAGLLHDIGKIDVSGQILRKAAQLTTEERRVNQRACRKRSQTTICSRVCAQGGCSYRHGSPQVLRH